MTPIIFTHPEYRTLAFKRSGIKNLHPFDKQIRGKIIREYEDLPFDPDSLIAPSSLHKRRSPAEASALQPNPPTLHDVARSVLRNQFIDFGDPDHLALIRLDGLAILASARYRIEFRLPKTCVGSTYAPEAARFPQPAPTPGQPHTPTPPHLRGDRDLGRNALPDRHLKNFCFPCPVEASGLHKNFCLHYVNLLTNESAGVN